MYLTPAQEKVSKGEYGEATGLTMELATRLGDLYEADRLVPIASSHTLAHFSSLHQAGIDLFEKFASLGGKFLVYTTVDPARVEFGRSNELGFPRAYVEKQMRLRKAHLAMGISRAGHVLHTSRAVFQGAVNVWHGPSLPPSAMLTQ